MLFLQQETQIDASQLPKAVFTNSDKIVSSLNFNCTSRFN